jgi:hypothetical protein
LEQQPSWQLSAVQRHAPPVQIVLAGHGWPQPPQLVGSVCVLTQVPLQQVVLPGSVHPSVSPVQQALFAMQTSPHGLESPSHWHTPAAQAAWAGQVLPQPPQLLLLVCVSMHPVAQQVDAGVF